MEIDKSLLAVIGKLLIDIQETVVDMDSYSPYYPLTDKLIDLKALLSVEENNEEFMKYLHRQSINPLEERINMASWPVPSHLDGMDFKNHTISQMKGVASQAVKCFKLAYQHFGKAK